MTIIPAYGRDYRSKKAVQADLREDKDFVVADISSRWNGSYINLSDMRESNIREISIRYAKGTKVAVIRI
jgi:hypothetical protein